MRKKMTQRIANYAGEVLYFSTCLKYNIKSWILSCVLKFGKFSVTNTWCLKWKKQPGDKALIWMGESRMLAAIDKAHRWKHQQPGLAGIWSVKPGLKILG